MGAVLGWAWAFTLPGLLLSALSVGRRPGAASQGGPIAMFVLAAAWLLGDRRPFELRLDGWLPFLPTSAFHVRVDALSVLMLAIVGAVATCVYVFSLGYMDDPEYSDRDVRRFFCFLDIFVATMAILVLAGNIAVLLVGWTGVGLSSFLLISFRRKLPYSLGAGLQALAANAIGDAALLLAVVVVPAGCGDLLTLGSAACVALPGGAALIAWLVFIAAAAKSAQGPLYFWLPTAMAGPTPVSALIHAATMVAAGVYLLVRTHALLEAAPSVALVAAWVGTITALAAGAASCVQTNFKRGLAYSTVSQLGYMFAAAGLLAPFAAIFHLLTHASYKALLFLTAGMVIHAKHGHEELADLRGLRKVLPGAHLAFLVGSLALVGVPGSAGALSKDAILDAAQEHNMALAICLLVGAGLTGLYAGRLFFGVFYGPPADGHDVHAPSPLMSWPLVPLAIGAVVLGYLEWPSGALSGVLGDTVGHPEHLNFASMIGLFAAVLGIAGFALSPWFFANSYSKRGEAGSTDSWVVATASLGGALAARLAGAHSGRLGSYAMASILGIVALVAVGVVTMYAGVVVNMGVRP
ncbi:MAG: proton-conducting transporter membrane subunit [Chloroflexota bacterium]